MLIQDRNQNTQPTGAFKKKHTEDKMSPHLGACVSCNAWLELLMTTILGLKTTILVRKKGEGAEDK